MGLKSVDAECQVSERVNPSYEWVKQRVVYPEIISDRVRAWLMGNTCMDEGSAAPSMVADAIVHHRLDDKQELVQAVEDSAGTLCR